MAAPSILTLILTLIPAAAFGDWIRTREGALVETRGAWKVKGPTVVFTAANGTLSSLRLSEVDLDASAVATFEAQRQVVPPEPAATHEPVLVLTNKDVPRAGAGFLGGEEAQGEEAQGGEAVTQAAGAGPSGSDPTLSVVSWKTVENSEVDGLELQGTLMNNGAHIAANLRIVVSLYDEAGKHLGTSNAFLGAISVAPTSSVKFRALFPEVSAASVEPKFDVRSTRIELEASSLAQSTEEAGNES